MGYGEYGGDGSVQVSNLLSNPAQGADCQLSGGNAAWNQANSANPSRLSARAQGMRPNVQPGQKTFIALDQVGSPGNLGQFSVTVNFQSAQELNIARQAFDNAIAAGATGVTFNVNIRANTPGQIQIAWPDA